MFKKTFYGAKISPACAYCAHGSPAPDQRMGAVPPPAGSFPPISHCRNFLYDPLLRTPRRQELPHFEPEDFSLED